MSGLGAFKGRWFVVKIGGELAADRPKLAGSVGAAVRAFLDAGVRVAVIHGGGPQATELTNKLGLTPRMVAGRRVTDEATLEVVKMTLAGQVSVDVAAAFRLAGVPALCTTGVSAGLIDARKRPPKVITGAGPEPIDLGLVGDVTDVNTALFERLSEAGLVPVLGSLSGDAQGQVFNINADTVATRVAAKLRAAKLFLVSNVPGVLADKNDPSTRIPTLTPAEAQEKIALGVIQGGMIPKVEESLSMLEEGIEAIHIVGISPAHALLGEAQGAGSFGTAFLRNR
ncbi:acetylglutamate kinase [Stigmatella aurantiaca]|uniref:Acetylglutamate kinase n=1 Tax=Stigmatella aurantiaca (strain DW4/3-1) TaxID=378806 RepID=Q096B1_STIAD|nr:acetylglutamate kinase [Stigmatella aurantiaca]ADO74920.1 Acetylglutamate kinase [Stigmatella aurantiaca DW4/3-1]EAU67566.1 acetylglutamate kinase [Stigmatella aurantiaca DW4/3-1]